MDRHCLDLCRRRLSAQLSAYSPRRRAVDYVVSGGVHLNSSGNNIVGVRLTMLFPEEFMETAGPSTLVSERRTSPPPPGTIGPRQRLPWHYRQDDPDCLLISHVVSAQLPIRLAQRPTCRSQCLRSMDADALFLNETRATVAVMTDAPIRLSHHQPYTTTQTEPPYTTTK